METEAFRLALGKIASFVAKQSDVVFEVKNGYPESIKGGEEFLQKDCNSKKYFFITEN